MSATMPVHVVCAVIVREDNRILVAKRPKGKRLGGLWEFPGGKVEVDEKPISALERELKEELGLVAKRVTHLMDVSHSYDWGTILLSAFLTHVHEGTPRLLEHEEIEWCEVSDLHKFEWAPADLPIVTQIQTQGSL